MIRGTVLTLTFLPFSTLAAYPSGHVCTTRGHYAEEMLLSAVTEDGVKGFVRDKTAVGGLNLSSFSDAFARQLAQADTKNGNGLSFKDYYSIYHDNGAMTLTVKPMRKGRAMFILSPAC
ncbi:hypothetical protein ACQZWC_004679 [Enterobacter bugandensis]